MALTALREPDTLWWRITCNPSPSWWVASRTYLHFLASGMWWHICTIRTTRVLHSPHGLQLCSSCLHNGLKCLCPSPAECHIFPLHYCHISDAAQSPYRWFALRCCHLFKYSLRFRYIACDCIGFDIIVFYRSEIYWPIFTLTSTMPSILKILRWSIIGLRCFFHLICICIVALIPIDIASFQVNPLKFSRGPTSPAGDGAAIALVAFVTLIFVIHTAPWHPNIQFIIRAIDVHRDDWVSASTVTLHKCHFGGQIDRKNSIANRHCFPADDHGRCWVLRLLDLPLDCSKSVFIHPLLVALQ